MYKTLLIAAMIIFSEAHALELKSSSGTIFLPEKDSWTLSRDIFGIPFLLFSPKINGQRSNISFINSGVEVEIDVNALSSHQKEFQDNKKKWADSVGATINSFISYENFKNKNAHKVHHVGVSYTHENMSYVEKSYYVECKGKLIYSKSLHLKINEKHDQDFKEMIENLDCGGV